MQNKYLYLTFTALLGCVVIFIALLFKYVEADYTPDKKNKEYKLPKDFTTMIESENYKDSWVYKMNLQKNQNKFSYPETIYHIKLN